MSEQPPRADVHPTDEPDGTPASAASMRPAGESVTQTDRSGADPGDEFTEDEGPTTPPFERPVLPGESRAGYDVADVAGDAQAVRPE